MTTSNVPWSEGDHTWQMITECFNNFDISCYGISSNFLGYGLILAFFCMEYHIFYKGILTLKPDLTEKQKSWIMSIKSSLIMFLIGVYYNYHCFSNNFNEESFYNVLDSNGGVSFGKIIVLYFTAYLIMDVYIGNKEYHNHMKSLSGYFHHSIYIVVNIVSLYFGVFPLYLLHMLSELPTFLLAIGSFDSSLRNDDVFGATFFTTRIVYHIFLTWLFRRHSLLFYCSLSALGLHCYWFSLWAQKYFFPNTKDKKSKSKLKSSGPKKRVSKARPPKVKSASV